MKIVVMGTGGVGGFYGGMLAKAGQDVAFVARGAHLAALQAHGLRVESQIAGDFALPKITATDKPATLGAAELVLMTTKSYWSYGKVNYKDGAMNPESGISVGLLFIFELTRMRDFSINNGRGRLVERVGPHSQ